MFVLFCTYFYTLYMLEFLQLKYLYKYVNSYPKREEYAFQYNNNVLINKLCMFFKIRDNISNNNVLNEEII